MSELTYDVFVNLPFLYVKGLLYEGGATRMYRNENYGLHIEIVTKKDKYGEWGEGKQHFYVDGDPNEYANVAEQYEAYMRKVCGITEEDEQ